MLAIYQTNQTVFDLKDLAKILSENNYDNLKSKVSYYTKKWYIYRIRKGIYTKKEYDIYELACKIYTPSYISFETVLSVEWVIYQSYQDIYVASYLSRTIQIWTHTIHYRKLKDDILFDNNGILRQNYYNIADKNRAISDMKYIYPKFYFDNLPDGNTKA